MNMFDLRGKVALVTGAGNGLGRGYAVNLAKANATIVCLGRNIKKLNEVVEEIKEENGKAVAIQTDITDRGHIKNAIEKIIQVYGKIDILINNAGTEFAEPFSEVTEEHFDSIMNVNIKGTYMMSQEAAEYMKKQKSGKIINIGSLGSYIGLVNSSVYCSSKGAVIQFTKSIALELAPYNIQVNAIAPGYFLTDMTKEFFEDEKHSAWIKERIPLGRIGTTDDIAGTAVFLASNASDYITGQTIAVDGGWLAG